MNWEFIIQKVSDTSWQISIMVSVISLLKLGISQWFLVKLAEVKTSKIIVRNNEKTASYHKPEEGEKVACVDAATGKVHGEPFTAADVAARIQPSGRRSEVSPERQHRIR